MRLLDKLFCWVTRKKLRRMLYLGKSFAAGESYISVHTAKPNADSCGEETYATYRPSGPVIVIYKANPPAAPTGGQGTTQ